MSEFVGDLTFSVASCRAEGLMRLLRSLQVTRYATCAVRICAQRFSVKELHALATLPMDLDVRAVPVLLGPYLARLRILEAWQSVLWCNLDDDCILRPETDYDPALDILKHPQVGIISAGWTRSMKPLVPPKDPLFVKQPIVYTGGGFLYTDPIARLVMAHPARPYLFDNVEWSLLTYLSGRLNFRYRGSTAYAMSATATGRREWVRLGERALPDSRYITVRPTKASVYGNHNDVHIPDSDDLTTLAHIVHLRRRAAA